MALVVAAFYKFVRLPDFANLRQPLLNFCAMHEIRGTILLAEEGINGTIAGSRSAIDAVLTHLRQDPRFADLTVKESQTESTVFDRLKIKLKKEIVTLGIPQVNPDQTVGTYIKPQDWNRVISDPDVTVIDVRNEFEVRIGTFEGAIDPKTRSFREFPIYAQTQLNPAEHKKIAMFCTGGIRCEKASAYLISQGFDQVYHLEGGILNYLEQVPPEESLWRGECFVFDQRVAVAPGVVDGSHEMCRACGHPISEADKASEHYEKDVSCPYCISLTPRAISIHPED